MSLDRQEYPTMVAALEPSHAVDVLNERVRLVGQVNSGIADWLQERRRIEEQYSSSLRKLSRRAAIADPQELGVFATPWSAMLANLDTLADIHANLASKIDVDVEQPLRHFNSTNREMTSMGNMQGNLGAMARDIDAAQKKSEKAKGGSKAANATSELETARAQWDAQAPFVFESLQALDENRLNHLRDVLTQLQTHEVDKVERNRVAAEQCLNILLTVETADEIKTFAMRTASSEPRPASSRRPSNLQSSSTFSAFPSTPSADDRTSQRSDSLSELPTPKSDKPRGLRRLGTVLSRRRESKIPAGAGRLADETPEKKSRLQSSSTFGSLSRASGRSAALDPPLEEEPERPRSPLRTVTSYSEAVEEPPATNGTGAVEPPVVIPNGSHQNDLAGLSLSQPATQSSNDAQGYSDANKARDLDPISAAEQEAAGQESGNQAIKVAIQDQPVVQHEGDEEALSNMATTLKMQAPQVGAARRQGTIRGRRDNRASVYDSPGLSLPMRNLETAHEQPYTIPESPAQTATAAVPLSSPQPAAASPFGTQPPFANLTPGPASPAFAPRPMSSQRDDNGSIRSGRSLGSSASGTNRHPAQVNPGLNASIIETVSATFEAGSLVRSTVIGEVALTNNSTAASPQSETIRLSHYASLGKVAPNPAFLSNTSTPGSYAFDPTALGRGRSQIAFKYQLASADTLAPLVLHPQWKIEPSQASAIISYSLHPSFPLDTVTLTDVTIILHLGDSAKASSCLSRPVGTFNKEKSVIYWTLSELALTKAGAPQRLLARFATEGEATQGRVEARWTVEQAGREGTVEVLRGGDDPFTDAEVERWVGVDGETSKRLVAGSYVAS